MVPPPIPPLHSRPGLTKLPEGSEEFTRKMVPVRRDSVASILMNLYILAGALRAKRPVPRYLPSAAAARKKLLDRMAEIEKECEMERVVRPRSGMRGRRWADVYRGVFPFSFFSFFFLEVEGLANVGVW